MALRQAISTLAGTDRDDDNEGEEDEDGELEGGEGILGASAKTIGWSTVKGYVTAVTDLWQQQQLRGVNSDPNPRQGPVTQLLAVEQLKETERKRSQHVDRGIDPLGTAERSADGGAWRRRWRSLEAQMAELGGAEEGQVRRAGRWNSKVMEACYLSAVPREVLRVHAGFTRDGGSYFLSRDVYVKEELLKKVFPWADDWDAAISTGKTADGKRVEINIAARGFVRLLLRLRKVIIQDAVVLRKIFPNWFVWSHSLFSDRLFLQYERDLLESLDTPAASDDRIAQVLPLLADQIAANTAAMQQAMASGFVAVGAQIASFSHQQNIILAEQQKFHGAQIQALHQHINALSGMYMGALSARPPLSTTTPSPIAAHGLPSSTGSTTAADSSSTHSFADTARSPRPSLPSLLPPTSLPPSSSFSPVLPSLPLLGPFPPVPPVVSQQPARLEAPTPVTADNGAVVARDEEVMPPFAQDRAVSSVVQL
ncbi:unnamed protein product [Tilletia controversa]|nr:unnamed protein product [Tilletia controversa]